MTPRPGQAAAPKKQTRAEFVDAQKRDAAHDAGTKAAYKDYTDKLAALNLKSFATPADKEKAQKDLENAYNAKIQENERAFHKGEKNPQGHKIGDVVLYKGQKIRITAIDPNTGKATGEPVGD
jgi:hypothetical protein